MMRRPQADRRGSPIEAQTTVAWLLFGIILLIRRRVIERQRAALLSEGDEILSALETWNPTKTHRSEDLVEEVLVYRGAVSRFLAKVNPDVVEWIEPDSVRIRKWADYPDWPRRTATLIRDEQKKLGRKFRYDY
jgi:hypothetical protein